MNNHLFLILGYTATGEFKKLTIKAETKHQAILKVIKEYPKFKLTLACPHMGFLNSSTEIPVKGVKLQ